MSLGRVAAVFALELRALFRRPMFWSLLLMVGFLAWGMSTGSVKLGTGSAFVGGKKAWITSEFSNSSILAIVASSFFPFFVAIASGMSPMREREERVDEVLGSTPLTARELGLGKALAYLAGFALALAVQLVCMVFFNHVVPHPSTADIYGPLSLAAYLRPALIFAVPTVLFYAGTAFYVGARWRRGVPVTLLPLVVLLAEFSLLWNAAPTWLDPRLDRLLMFLDPSGFRWLDRVWLKLDRGSDFYNTAVPALDGLILSSRLFWAALGVACIVLALRHMRAWRPAADRATKRSPDGSTDSRPASLAAARAPRVALGFWPALIEVARVEMGAILREPGLYLLTLLVWAQTFFNTRFASGVFETPVLWTSGQLAAQPFNTLLLLLPLLLLIFAVDALSRETTTGAEAMVWSAPPSTTAWLLGKLAAVGAVAVVALAAVFAGGVITLLAQGRAPFELWPYVLVWGLLLTPTLLVFTALCAAAYAITGSRTTTFGIAAGVLGLTLYHQLTGGLSWVGNWLLWGGARWSDISVFELDRKALVLNRLWVLGLAVCLTALAAFALGRRRPDPMRWLHRLAPRPLARTLLRFASWAAAPVGIAVVLGFGVAHGFDGEAAQRDHEDYWKENLNTWQDAPSPAIERVDVELELEPREHAFAVRGSYILVNREEAPMSRFGVTTGRHWRDLSFTLGPVDAATEVAPENRSGLYVFELERPLEPGERLELGFAHHGRLPDGISEKGSELRQFILPSSVVLGSFGATFVPELGFNYGLGVDDDNRANPPQYDPQLYLEQLPPSFGEARPFSIRVAVTLPADMHSNGPGRLVADTVDGKLRRQVWESDHPVRIWNVVAGRWDVIRGEGTAIYYHPGHAYNVEAMLSVLDDARHHYSRWFAPYPWEELRLSEFAAVARYAQGFPTNITFSEGIGFLTLPAKGGVDPVFIVTAHEAAHQWWGNMLTPGYAPGGALLSEALAELSTALLYEEIHGEEARIAFFRRLESRYGERRFHDEERPLVEIDYQRRGDRSVTYNKGAWALWMLEGELGREAMLAGLRQLIAERRDGPDFPVVQDLLATLRVHATDPEAFDRVAEQWFYEVVLPEYRLSDAELRRAGEGYEIAVTVENVGTGEAEVSVAATRGERFDAAGDYREARTAVVLGAGESRRILLRASFEPERLVVDPDLRILQLRRESATIEL